MKPKIFFLKNIAIFTICLFYNIYTIRSQSNQENLEKYWHYRYRLTHHFMIIGDQQGEGIPANSRNKYTDSYDNSGNIYGPYYNRVLYWGEGPVQLGYYIGVLATEYHLLKKNGQNVDQTLTELSYALNAVWRLDVSAEVKYGLAPSLNGFMLRDDVPETFLANNNHLAELNNYNNQPLTDVGPLPNYTYGSGEPGFVNAVASDYSLQYRPSNPDAELMWPASQDQLFNLLMGFALVKKYVDEGNLYFTNTKTNTPGFNYNFRGFVNTETGLIVNYMKHSPFDSYKPQWRLDTPDGLIKEGNGGWAFMYCYGIAEAGKYITGTDYHDNISLNEHASWNGFASTECERKYDIVLPLVLAAIGDSWNDRQVWVDWHWNNDYEIPILVLGHYEPTGNTREGIQFQGDYDGDSKACGSWVDNHVGMNQFYGAIHRVLHGQNFGDDPSLDLCYIQYMLNTAPPNGPYYHNSSDFSQYDGWRSDRRYYDSPPDQQTGSSPGNYNGLDYMLMHNLYYCLQETGTDHISENMPKFDFPGGLDYYNFEQYFNYRPYNHTLVENTNIYGPGAFGSYYGKAEIIGGAQGVTLGNNVNVEEGAILDVHIDELCSAGPGNFLYNPAYYKTMATTNNTSSDASSITNNYIMSDEFKIQNAITISPNPSNGTFNISITKNKKAIGIKELKVIDMMGKIIWQTGASANTIFDVDITNYAQGIYYVRSINEDGETEVQKLIKQ